MRPVAGSRMSSGARLAWSRPADFTALGRFFAPYGL